MRCLLFFAFVVITSLSFANRWSITEGNLFVDAGTITGRLISDDGQPIANANITLKPAGGSISTIRRLNTDEDGKFVVNDLSSRSYIITATVPGYVMQPDAAEEHGKQKYYHTG